MKNIKKTMRLLLGCMACTAVLSVAGASGAQAEQTELPLSEPVFVSGTIHKENGRLSLTNIQGDTAQDELILNISEETRILDAVNGFPVAYDSLTDGEKVYAYISHAMTMSIPPQSHAEMIICGIPAGFEAPLYETAEDIVFGDNGAAVVKSVRGNTYYIDASSVLLPYLTRNIVTVQDLTKERTFLVWKTPIGTTGENAASKIVMFPAP